MSLTLAQSITEVRDILNEATPAFWTDSQITKWIQEGSRIFSSKTLLVEDTQVLDPPIANKLVYTATEETWIGDVLEIYAAIYDDGSQNYKGLIKVHPRQIGNVATTTAGPPKYYCLHDRSIYIWPLPSAAVITNGQISFLIAKETDDITAITDEFQHLPIIYAVAKCKQKDQKFAEASSFLAQFYQELQFERQDKHAREVDSLDKFKIPAKGGGSESADG
jgi:hypothetical protein